MTMAPDRLSTPWATALLPSIAISAPRRLSSWTCINRFSKIVSVIVALPLAMAFRTINCACISVGKAGYSEVVKLTGLGRPAMLAAIQSGPISIFKPASLSLANKASKLSGRHCFTKISPPVTATAHKNVPASMRSGRIVCVVPCSRSTPSMTKRSEPRPTILAPIFTNNSAKLPTSGSRAAFSKIVVPCAKQAAINKFSVPVTVIMSVKIVAPKRCSA